MWEEECKVDEKEGRCWDQEEERGEKKRGEGGGGKWAMRWLTADVEPKKKTDTKQNF